MHIKNTSRACYEEQETKDRLENFTLQNHNYFPFMFWSLFVSLMNFFNSLEKEAWIKNQYVTHYYFIILSFAS